MGALLFLLLKGGERVNWSDCALSKPLWGTGINAFGFAGFALMVAGALVSLLANRYEQRKKTMLKLAGLLIVIIGAAAIIAFGKNV